MKKLKKPYEKPALKGKIIFEASGLICCKLSAGGCGIGTMNGAGKNNKTQDSS